MTDTNIIICLTCKTYTNIQSGVESWIMEHIHHDLITDNTLEWFNNWVNK